MSAALRGIDSGSYGSLAAEVHAIGEDDGRFPALLFLQDVLRGKHNGIVE